MDWRAYAKAAYVMTAEMADAMMNHVLIFAVTGVTPPLLSRPINKGTHDGYLCDGSYDD